MKTTKFTITVCAVILGAGILFAEKPTDKGKKEKSYVFQVIDQLSVDIVLTDSQKLMIGRIDQDIRFKFKNKVNQSVKELYNLSLCDFRATLDTILTDEQKQLLDEKRIEKNIEATKKFNPKNKNMKSNYARLIVLTYVILFANTLIYAQTPPDETYTQNPFGGNLILSSAFCQPYDSCYYEEDNYTEWYYNWDYYWRIEVPQNTPIKFEYTKNSYDYFEIYTNDQRGYRQFASDYSTGTKSVIVFSSDNYIWVRASASYWGEPPTGSIFNLNFAIESGYSISNGSYNSSNTIIDGKLGIGTLSPQKKLEIWDGNSARFTFSGSNCTNDGYEVEQTIDNLGYKINVGYNKSYRIAIGGSDVFKIMNNHNLGIGYAALNNTTTGSDNYGIGQNALYSNTSGYQNIAIGRYSMNKNTTGLQNTAVGNYSLMTNTTGVGNTAIGTHVLKYSTTGNHNTGIGHGSLESSTSGYNNISIGSIALRSNTIGYQNQAVGFGALSDNISGTNNIGIGYYAGSSTDNSIKYTSSHNSIFIGNNAKALADGQSNQIVIGNNTIGNGNNTVTIGNNEIVNTFLKGKVSLGTLTPDQTPNVLLTVNGTIHTKEVLIDLNAPLADYVFSPDYSLMPLHKVEAFVKTNKHLPEIPSAAEVKEKGLSMGEMQNKLLQKIEELTLYVIELQKTNEKQSAEIEALKGR